MHKTVLAIAVAFPLFAEEWCTETLHDGYRQSLKIEKILYEEKTEHQHLLIFENAVYGRVLALDGVIQVTEKDEFIYQEMMSHVPLLAHGNCQRVLIIGGGDGGTTREVLRHKTVKRVVLAEIDESVIALSKKHLPFLSKGAFDDPRLEVVIGDGAQFVKNTREKFDVVICDSTDPEGPGAVLFTEEFYGDCHAILAEGGIFVNQNGVPFLQEGEFRSTLVSRKRHFADSGFYLAAVPTYAGGFMAFGWATDRKEYREVTVLELEKRLKNVEGALKYYTPALHKASFALPKFLETIIEEENRQE